ncbi:MAG: nucleotidyl transferase AbiEii/AbiGii toxin family protein, partial [Crocinitomicaceae bacterium]
WLLNHPSTAILFSETENTWNQIKDTYNTSFKELVFGELPPENDIKKTLIILGNRLKQIKKWNVDLLTTKS